MNFEETPEFQKELKRPGKKSRSPPADLQSFRNIAAVAEKRARSGPVRGFRIRR